ncbi:glyoxalase/bleomycin resistance/extradiol dioxygenase family protein [Novosphingobium sp. Gsoil 351]|nr:glyoxalase/bleomycin resistance/extradiol dioxygenase family protein [Novosphingobium sp. Gsoil 351]
MKLLDVAYARLKTPDLDSASQFATRVLGLEQIDRSGNSRSFRSDHRVSTLSYEAGDPWETTVGFELASDEDLQIAAGTLEAMDYAVRHGSRGECDQRHVRDFIAFSDPGGGRIEFAVSPHVAGSKARLARDAGITGFSHVGLFSQDTTRDEHFWTQVCSARVSDRLGELPLLRLSQIHHSIALVPADRSGVQHINHQVQSIDDVQRSYSLLRQHNVPIVFGPGRHPTSGARFVYFEGPDDMVFEYSVGVQEVDEATYRERQFGFEPSSLCMWGAKATLKELSN